MSKINMSKINMSKINMSKINMTKINMNKTSMTKLNTYGKKATFKRTRVNEDDDDILGGNSKQLGYFTQTQVSTCVVIPIDEEVKDAVYYRQVVQAINNTGEGDQIQFEISSNGGSLDGLLALLTACAKTEAIKVAHINSNCHSAASILALNCDSLYVSPYASMLVHFVSFGSSGKATDIKSHVNHVHSTSEQLFRETYEIFLSEEEIDKCIGGFELWLNDEEIGQRLENKFKVLEEMEKDLQELEAKASEKKAEEALVTQEEEEEWGTITKAKAIPKKKVKQP